MSYRFLKITTFYKGYLKYYYSKNGGIVNKPYIEQYNNLMRDSFGWANFYQKNLLKLGVNAHEIVSNAIPLQQMWASEHGVNKKGIELTILQAKALKPDVVFIQDTTNWGTSWIENLRKEVPSIRLIIGFCCSPFQTNHLETYKSFDFIITCSDLFSDIFRRAGLKVYRLNHAFEKTILEKINKVEPMIKSDLIFIGSLIGGNEQHNLRMEIVEEVLKSGINFKVHSQLNYDDPLTLLLKQGGYLTSKLLISLGLRRQLYLSQYLRKFAVLNEVPRNPLYSEKLRSIVNKPLYGLEMYRALMEAKMGLNIHGGFAGGKFAVNMRLFEVTGVGSCLITDWKENLHELFVPDEEVVTFKTAEECVEKVKWLLNNPKEIEKISIAGQKRTHSNHTFEIRAKQLDEIIRKELRNKVSPK